MSTSDYLLCTGLLLVILATRPGTRRPDGRRLLLPVAITAGIGARYLRALPAGTAAHLPGLAGLAAGPLSGLAAVAPIKVRRGPGDGRLVTLAGWPHAAIWTLALVLRPGFADGSTHWFTRALASFSQANHVPPATYGTAFTGTVPAMVVIRAIGVIRRGRAAGASIGFSGLRLAHRPAR